MRCVTKAPLPPGLLLFVAYGLHDGVLHMASHPYAAAVAFALMFLLPAVIACYFAWAVWSDRKYPISNWRRRTFHYGLFSALTATVLVLPQCSYIIDTGSAGGGWLRFSVRVAAIFWIIGVTSALVAKGAARILLVAWGLLLLFGVLGIAVATWP